MSILPLTLKRQTRALKLYPNFRPVIPSLTTVQSEFFSSEHRVVLYAVIIADGGVCHKAPAEVSHSFLRNEVTDRLVNIVPHNASLLIASQFLFIFLTERDF